MDQRHIDFLRTALRGGDFDDDVVSGLLLALSELEQMQRAAEPEPLSLWDEA